MSLVRHSPLGHRPPGVRADQQGRDGVQNQRPAEIRQLPQHDRPGRAGRIPVSLPDRPESDPVGSVEPVGDVEEQLLKEVDDGRRDAGGNGDLRRRLPGEDAGLDDEHGVAAGAVEFECGPQMGNVVGCLPVAAGPAAQKVNGQGSRPVEGVPARTLTSRDDTFGKTPPPVERSQR